MYDIRYFILQSSTTLSVTSKKVVSSKIVTKLTASETTTSLTITGSYVDYSSSVVTINKTTTAVRFETAMTVTMSQQLTVSQYTEMAIIYKEAMVETDACMYYSIAKNSN